MAKLTFLDHSVEGIFKILNTNKFNYAVINNYKDLPRVKNDIDILTNEPSKRILKIIKKIKKKDNWDYLTFCDNWRTPSFTQQSVETFNLYKKKGFKCLNIDFVRGLIFVNGVILEETIKILNQKKIYKNKYFHISEEYEFLMKVSGLSKEIKYHSYKHKNYKYFKNVLKKSKNRKLNEFLNNNKLRAVIKALYFLKHKEYYKFYCAVENFRRKFFFINFIKNPLLVIFNLFYRIKIRSNNILVPFLNKSKIIKININQEKIPIVKKIIKKFYKKKLFRSIYYLKPKIFLNRHEINCLNGGGTLIQFGKTLKNAINIGNKDSKINIENAIFGYAIKMNKIIK